MAQPASGQIEEWPSDDVPGIELLCCAVELRPAAFQQYTGHPGAIELSGDRDAGGPCTNDTDLAVDVGPLGDGAQIDEHAAYEPQIRGCDQPQISRAVSTTRRSLAFFSSLVSALPPRGEEKPHCGLRQSWSSGTYFAASSTRRFSSSLLSSAGRLLVTRPRTTRLPSLGTKRSGSKPPERA